MTDRVWEPLAEVEFNVNQGSETSVVYCLCSRAFIRSKIEGESWDELFSEVDRIESSENVIEPSLLPASSAVDDDTKTFCIKKQEAVEAVSCYCSASHYSTDDYDSVMQSAMDHSHKEALMQGCPLQNSDSGADLSENCCKIAEEGEQDETVMQHLSAWDKYWADNGEDIIWKSWIEKYGAYINPTYLESGSADADLTEKDDRGKDVEVLPDPSQVPEAALVPDVKVSRYSSCSNHSEGEDAARADVTIKPEKILKSSSLGSCEGEQRVRSRCSNCSNTNLSVKSVANTTVTTDSMTNVTKITLSSLDLSCECSLLSSSSEDNSCLTSPSSSSSKEEMCTEADQWWKRVWKEHYQEQYSLCYQAFNDGCLPDQSSQPNQHEQSQTNNEPPPEATQPSEPLLPAAKQERNKGSEAATTSSAYIQSVGYLLQRLEKNCSLDKCTDIPSEEKSEEIAVVEMEEDCETTKKQRQGHEVPSEMRRPKRSLAGQSGGWRSVKHMKTPDSMRKVMTLIGLACSQEHQEQELEGQDDQPQQPSVASGFVTYRKRNIRGQNRRLNLGEAKPRLHLMFDEDGNAFPVQGSEPVNLNINKQETTNIAVVPAPLEPESLGYEAHSSSLDDDEEGANKRELESESNQVRERRQRKKKKKQKKVEEGSSIKPPEVLDNKALDKYWRRRYQLFLRFDEGIHLDAESWYSVTPEKVARHHASRCRSDVIIDAFCGAGGNTIQFAFTCERVIAIDVDPEKVKLARHNARIYGVEERIEFIVGDFTQLASQLKADVVFLSPPWGGPEYLAHDSYSLDKILPGVGGVKLFQLARNITQHVAYFLPRNCNVTEMTMLAGPGGETEVEQDFLDRKLISVTAYYGGLIMSPDHPQLDEY